MIMIIITVMIMNVEYIWLTSLNEMQIKVSSAVAYDFNQLIYTVCALTGRLAAPREKKTFPVHPWFVHRSHANERLPVPYLSPISSALYLKRQFGNTFKQKNVISEQKSAANKLPLPIPRTAPAATNLLLSKSWEKASSNRPLVGRESSHKWENN